MRMGVTAEKSWQHYDPSGLPSAYALAQAKSRVSATDAASVEAQHSAVDSNQPDSTNPVSSATTVTQKEQEGDANVNDSSSSSSSSSSADSAAAAAAAAEVQEEGYLSGITGSLSGWFS
ncbi:unnamed protein product [Ectocarpus sp. 8 AP-2014]